MGKKDKNLIQQKIAYETMDIQGYSLVRRSAISQ